MKRQMNGKRICGIRPQRFGYNTTTMQRKGDGVPGTRANLATILFLLAAGCCLTGCNGGTITNPTVPDARVAINSEDAAVVPKDDSGGGVFIALDALLKKDVRISTCVPDPVTGGCGIPAGCGNGSLDTDEECDDSNNQSGDGCSMACRQETDWVCPNAGSPCVSTVVCGDGRISGKEACDDRNTNDGDGCSADCSKVETGWVCAAPGVRCQPKCGDGVLTGWEDCDDGNAKSGDGCSEGCKVEEGFACPKANTPCHETVCGDKIQEGSESCDDGNTLPGDGCAPDCRAEPICTGTSGCTSPCGDGLKLPDEDCDDGNTRSGDGCSDKCKLEPGWGCIQEVEGTNSDMVVPIVYRDMIPQTASIKDPPPHPNFEIPENGKLTLKVVKDTLGSDRKPVYNPSVDATLAHTTNATDFDSWYHDSKYSKVVVDTLALLHQPDGTFMYDHSSYYSSDIKMWLRPAFFPLDNKGWAAQGGPEIPFLGTCDLDNSKHNFSFTSELHYWFEFKGGETLDFIGDDDVWVFLNGTLAVDLGGLHEAEPGSITLTDTTAKKFNMTKGKVYEIALFQAERKQTRSSYKLTLGQFSRVRTNCEDRCGDGIVNGSEVCDDGPKNADNTYGGCTTKCTVGPFCGDAKTDTQFGEECDDGVNQAQYGQSKGGCGPGCRTIPYCGDGKVDSIFDEACDDGDKNGKGTCTTECGFIIP
jgi:fibro-slime domain-containing protein